jgi:hypothetical protein
MRWLASPACLLLEADAGFSFLNANLPTLCRRYENSHFGYIFEVVTIKTRRSN